MFATRSPDVVFDAIVSGGVLHSHFFLSRNTGQSAADCYLGQTNEVECVFVTRSPDVIFDAIVSGGVLHSHFSLHHLTHPADPRSLAGGGY